MARTSKRQAAAIARRGPFEKDLVARLRQVMGGDSASEFARRLGCARPTTVNNWLNDGIVPNAAYLRNIAELTGYSVDWLLGFTEVPSLREERSAIGPLGVEFRAYVETRFAEGILDSRGRSAGRKPLSEERALIADLLPRGSTLLDQSAASILISLLSQATSEVSRRIERLLERTYPLMLGGGEQVDEQGSLVIRRMHLALQETVARLPNKPRSITSDGTTAHVSVLSTGLAQDFR